MNIEQVTELFPSVFSIQEGVVRMYLICGGTRALLLDTGFGGSELRARVKEHYDGPLLVVNTHGHVDHVGGNKEFETVHAHPADWPAICTLTGMEPAQLRPLRAGERLELGGRTLEVLETPGHTPGSIALLDRDNRLLFAGDTVSDRPVFLFLEGASIADYITTLKRLVDLRGAYDVILGCHGEAKQDSAMAQALLDCACALSEGTLTGTPMEDYNGIARMLYTCNGASIYGNAR